MRAVEAEVSVGAVSRGYVFYRHNHSESLSILISINRGANSEHSSYAINLLCLLALRFGVFRGQILDPEYF